MAIQRVKYTPAQTHTLTYRWRSYGAVTWSFWQLLRGAWGLIITFSPLEGKNISFRLQLSLSLSFSLCVCSSTQLWWLSKWDPQGSWSGSWEAPPNETEFNLAQFCRNDPSYRMYKNE